MTSKQKPTKKLARRNPLHDHPMLRKGGVHRQSHKSKRRLDKVNLNKEWLPQNIFSRVYFEQAILY